MEHNTEVKEISRNDIEVIVGKLKKLDKNWAKILTERIAATEPDFKVTKLYNIINGSVPNQKYRRIFITHAQPYLAELEQQQTEAVKLMQENSDQ